MVVRIAGALTGCKLVQSGSQLWIVQQTQRRLFERLMLLWRRDLAIEMVLYPSCDPTEGPAIWRPLSRRDLAAYRHDGAT
jgi:hypothetical protein